MAGIFPPADKGGRPPGGNVCNGYSPQHRVVGEGPLYVAADCTTVFTDCQLNSIVSEILAAIDQVNGGVPYNASRIDNLAQALTDAFNQVNQRVAAKVNRTGDTLEGPLNLSRDPQGNLEAATKRYVDVADANLDSTLRLYIDNAVGGISTGWQAPLAALDAAKVDRAGDTMGGPLTLARQPVLSMEATTKSYVDNQIALIPTLPGGGGGGGTGGIPEAPYDDRVYGRMNQSWQPITGQFLPLAGGTVTGTLAVNGAMQAASITMTGGGFPLQIPAGGFTVAGASVFGAGVTVNGTLVPNGGGYAMQVPNGGISVSGASMFGSTITSNAGGWAIRADYGSITCGGAINCNYVIAGTGVSIFSGQARFDNHVLCNSIFTAVDRATLLAGFDTYGTCTIGTQQSPTGSLGVYSSVPDPMIVSSYSHARINYWVVGIGYWAAGLQTANQWTITDTNTGAAFTFQSNGVFNANYVMAGVGVYQPGGGPTHDSSDARIKTVQISYRKGLAELEQIQPVIYRFNGNDSWLPPTKDEQVPYPGSPHYLAATNRTPFIGLVAQDLETVMPEMVRKRTGYIDGNEVNDLRDLDTGPLIYALVNAVKELSARVKALEAAR